MGTAPVLVHNDNCPIGGDSAPTYVGTPKDPSVPRLVDAIEDRYPGHVVAVEIKIVGADGKDITDFDIVTRNAVIQVKTGSGPGSRHDHERYESATDYPVISFIWPSKRLKPSVVKGQERAGQLVTTDLEELRR